MFQQPPVPTHRSLGPGALFFVPCMALSLALCPSYWWAIVAGVGGTGFLSAAWQVFEYWNDRRRGLVRQSRWHKSELRSTRHIAMSVLWFLLLAFFIVTFDPFFQPLGVGLVLASIPSGLLWFLIHRNETAEERERAARRNPAPPPAMPAPRPNTVNVPPV